MALRERARGVYERPSTIVSGPVRFTWKLIVLIIFIVLLILGGIFIYRAFVTGSVGLLAQNAITTLDNSVVGPTLKFFGIKGVEYFEDPSKIGSDPWKSTVIQAESEEFGLEFGSLRTVDYEYNVGDDIEADSIVTITSIDDVDLTFNCILQKGVVGGERINGDAEPTNVHLEAEGNFVSEVFPVTCRFTDVEDVGSSPTLYLSTTYPAKAKAYHDIYFLPKEKLDDYRSKGIYGLDIFKEEGITNFDKANLHEYDGNVYTRTENIRNPIKIELEEYPQPLTEESPSGRDYYRYKIDLEKDISWDGYPKELKSLIVKLPPNLEINEDADFYDTGEETDYDYKIYKLKQEKIEKTNEECSVIDIFLLSDECIDKWKDGIPNKFVLEFGVGYLEEDTIYYQGMEIETEYMVDDYVRGYAKVKEIT